MAEETTKPDNIIDFIAFARKKGKKIMFCYSCNKPVDITKWPTNVVGRICDKYNGGDHMAILTDGSYWKPAQPLPMPPEPPKGA